MFMGNNYRSWVEIDLDVLVSNLRIYKGKLRENTEIMAVVKADAYGHGDLEITKCLSTHGVRYFAVSNIDEAVGLRLNGFGGEILILGYTPTGRLVDVYKHNITQTLLSEEYAKAAVASGYPIKCQFAIDTGMRRIGLNADDLLYCENVIKQYAKRLRLNGLFTHLCVADGSDEASVDFTREQIYKFKSVANSVRDLCLPYIHYQNSAGGLFHFIESSSFVRLGVILYGLKPGKESVLPQGIKPVMSWKSVIATVLDLEKGETVSYGRTYKAKRRMKIAAVPTGYADGYSRLLSNKGYVLVNGKVAPIVGQICMDQMLIDVSEIPDVKLETEVVLLGRSGSFHITADNLADMYGTIGYEVITGVSKRVARIYHQSPSPLI